MTNIYTAEEDMLLSKWYKQIRHGFGEWPCGCAGMVVTGWVRIYQGLIVQLVERWACNPEVAGSNPT